LRAVLRQLIGEGLNTREAAARIGLPYHEARQLIRAAEVADGVQADFIRGESGGT
jgi:hypothetical protein